MEIAVIGTGNVGGALTKQWIKAGHHIYLGVRDTSRFKGQELLKEKNVSAHSIAEAVQKAPVILIATPPPAITEIVKSMGDVSGKIIIDAVNSVRVKPEGYDNTFEALKDLCKNAELVKCFNSTGFENMGNPGYTISSPVSHLVKLDMFAAGNSVKAKQVAIQLSKDAGFENCYDFGGDDKAALLEQLALCWINLAIMQGNGRNIAFKIIKR